MINMLRIVGDDYSPMQPVKYNAIAVFDLKSAKLAFTHPLVDFLIVLNEKNGKFAKCLNLHDVEEFLSV